MLPCLLRLTPLSWVLLGKLPVVQLFKNFPTFYGTQRLITVFTRTPQWPLSRAGRIHSILPSSFYLRSILILPNYLRLGLPNSLFSSGFPTNMLQAFPFMPFVLHARPSHQVVRFLIMQFFQLPVILSLFGPNVLIGFLFTHNLSLHWLWNCQCVQSVKHYAMKTYRRMDVYILQSQPRH
jgi:hypothetical protein